MGNLTEELESGRVINCNALKHNKNQDHVRNFSFLNSLKKILLVFTRPLEISTITNLMNYPFFYLQIFHTLNV